MRVLKRLLIVLAALVVAVAVLGFCLRLANPRVALLGDPTPTAHGQSRELFVVMHGWTGSPEKLKDVVASIESTHPDADVLAPRFASGMLSNADPWALSANLDERIQKAVDARAAKPGGPYARIVLVGHSAGALMLRKAYVFARGSREDAPGGPQAAPAARTWPRMVTRIVLLAGINRGWTLVPKPAERPMTIQLAFRALTMFARATGTGGFVMNMERGSPFVANLRVQWIRLLQDASEPMPAVYQLLGQSDAIITHEDSQDLVGMPAFATIPVLGTGHAQIFRFDGTPAGVERREKFEQALLLEELDLARVYAPADTAAIAEQPAAPEPAPAATTTGATMTSRPASAEMMSPSAMRLMRERAAAEAGAVASPARAEMVLRPSGLSAARRPILASRLRPGVLSEVTRTRISTVRRDLLAKVAVPQRVAPAIDTARAWNTLARLQVKPRKHVVFVLHGIRDNGEFANDIRQRILSRSHESADSIEVLTDRYDRFAMLPFLLFDSRRKQVRWFMDRYTEALARSPGAKFSFIGHSNGTYALATALETYSTMRMGNVVFAGSVVPRHFRWNELAAGASPRVEHLLNVRAAGDFVVAVFPRFYEFIYEHSRLGWFADVGSAGFAGFEEDFAVRDEVAFVRGGHGAALDAPNADQLVDFALTGRCDKNAFRRQDKADGWVELASGLCGVIWLALVGLLAGSAWLILRIERVGLRVVLGIVYAVFLLFVLFNV